MLSVVEEPYVHEVSTRPFPPPLSLFRTPL